MRVDCEDSLSQIDYDVIMRREGYYLGYFGKSKVENLVDEIFMRFDKDLRIAEGISLEVYYSDKSLLSDIERLQVDIPPLLHERIDIILNCYFDERVPSETVEYELLLSGISNLGR